jgi:arylsulfatase
VSINHATILILLCVVASCGAEKDAPPQEVDSQRPNILLIVADDLGYSDLGSYGGEISTPTLDRLAGEGVRFSGFHVLPTCSPTRAALMSGNDNHVAGMGVMAEFIYPAVANLPGYAGHLADQVATIPEILRGSGYHTYMAGKWHLGVDDDQSPYAHGFEQTFAMMNGGGSHWADMRPLSLAEPMTYRRNGERIDELPEDFYSTTDYTDALIEFIDSNMGDGKPFFGYLSYTAPHDPLHAPAEYIEKYRGKYDEGWDVLATERRAGLEGLGLIPAGLAEFAPNFMTTPWGGLSTEDQRKYARDMEVYAAMVDYVDMSIGRLFDYLRENGLYDDTLIVFISDNGANGAHATAYPGNRDGAYLASFDNTLENRGLENSFVDMGPGWAQAVSTPFRLFKSFTSQGGIKAPMIVKAAGERSATGEWNHSFIHVTDILPTFLEVASATYPDELDGLPLRTSIGRSIMPILNSVAGSIRGQDSGVGYELFEMKAYIRGDWKLLRLPEPFGSGEWALYKLTEDPGEVHDVSNDYPEVRASMIEAWQEYAETNDVFDHRGVFDELYRKAYGAQ